MERILYGPESDPYVTVERFLEWILNMEPFELTEKEVFPSDKKYKLTINLERV